MQHGTVYRNEDSYCGPISMLTQAPDGDILLAFREAKQRGLKTHQDPTTRTSLLRSRDGGHTWFSHVTPDPSGGNGIGLTCLSDGTVMLNAFHWLFAPPDQEEKLQGYHRFKPAREAPNLNMASASGGIFLTRSWTDGYSWESPARIKEPEPWPDIVAHASPVELPNGDLLLPTTARRTPEGQSHAVVLRSHDKGDTWGEPVCITDDAPEDVSFHETRLVLCPGGRIVAMHRTKGQYWQNISSDEGKTWSATEETPIWCGHSSPPDMRVLSDGRLLLTRGYRREPYGVRAYVSNNEGDSWDVENEIVLRDDGPDKDVGYPSTIEKPDGELLTVYYWHDEDGIRHLQSTHWRV